MHACMHIYNIIHAHVHLHVHVAIIIRDGVICADWYGSPSEPSVTRSFGCSIGQHFHSQWYVHTTHTHVYAYVCTFFPHCPSTCTKHAHSYFAPKTCRHSKCVQALSTDKRDNIPYLIETDGSMFLESDISQGECGQRIEQPSIMYLLQVHEKQMSLCTVHVRTTCTVCMPNPYLNMGQA